MPADLAWGLGLAAGVLLYYFAHYAWACLMVREPEEWSTSATNDRQNNGKEVK